MKTDYIVCNMQFDDLNLDDTDACRARMIDFVNDEAFGTALQDLAVTSKALTQAPVARGAEGGCNVEVHGGAGGWGGSVGCGVRF